MDDLRIKGYNALLTPSYIKEEFPMASGLIWERCIYLLISLLVRCLKGNYHKSKKRNIGYHCKER